MLPLVDEMSRRLASHWVKPQNEAYITRANELISRHPAESKQFRSKMKGLLAEFLTLKFADSQAEVHAPPANSVVRFSLKQKGKHEQYELHQTFVILPSDKDRILDSKRRQVTLTRDESALFLSTNMPRIFNGNRVEIIENESIKGKTKRDNAFWYGWYNQMGECSYLIQCFPDWIKVAVVRVLNALIPASPPWHEYRTVIHPMIKKAALQVLERVEKPTVVELCGGNGMLANDILSACKKKVSYHLLELNSVARELAQENLSSMQQHCVQIVPQDIVKDHTYSDLAPDSVDLFIGSGALTTCVLEKKEEAKAVLKTCHSYLKPGGFVILAGHSDSLVNTSDFQELGFTPHNTHLVGYRQALSFYIMQKP